MLRFRKVTSENFRNWETSRYLSNFTFSGVICNDFLTQNQVDTKQKSFFLKGFITKNREGGQKRYFLITYFLKKMIVRDDSLIFILAPA